MWCTDPCNILFSKKLIYSHENQDKKNSCLSLLLTLTTPESPSDPETELPSQLKLMLSTFSICKRIRLYNHELLNHFGMEMA